MIPTAVNENGFRLFGVFISVPQSLEGNRRVLDIFDPPVLGTIDGEYVTYFRRKKQQHTQLWSINSDGELRFNVKLMMRKKLSFEVCLPALSSMISIRRLDCWFLHDALTNHGHELQLRNVFASVILELLVVDSYNHEVKVIVYEGQLKKALAFVFSILSVFCHNDEHSGAEEPVHVTSVGFKLSSARDSRKFILHSFNDLSRFSSSKRLSLVAKLLRRNLRIEQLPFSESTCNKVAHFSDKVKCLVATSNQEEAWIVSDRCATHKRFARKRLRKSPTTKKPSVSVKNIPIPGVRVVEDFNTTDHRVMPLIRKRRKYIHHVRTDVQMAMDPLRVLHDMDTEDENWLLRYNSRKCKKVVTEEHFERVMNMFEKVSYIHGGNVEFTDVAINDFASKDKIGSDGAVDAIYKHWRRNRERKGAALLRHLQQEEAAKKPKRKRGRKKSSVTVTVFGAHDVSRPLRASRRQMSSRDANLPSTSSDSYKANYPTKKKRRVSNSSEGHHCFSDSHQKMIQRCFIEDMRKRARAKKVIALAFIRKAEEAIQNAALALIITEAIKSSCF